MINRFSCLLFVIMTFAFSLLSPVSYCASSDIVPSDSVVLDAFSQLAKSSSSKLGTIYSASEFLTDKLYSRHELAVLFEKYVLNDKSAISDRNNSGSIRAILSELQPELLDDGVDVALVKSHIAQNALSSNLLGKYELRDNSEEHQTHHKQLDGGSYGLYRGAVNGAFNRSVRYGLDLSNSYEDYRRVFQNDVGPSHFQAVQEAFIGIDGGRGLQFKIGRFYDRAGPGYRGATMLSDNALPYDQIAVTFPFSLGQRLGRKYYYDQMATSYSDYGTSRYQEWRRVGYHFNSRWDSFVEEGFKSDDKTTLAYTLIPFDIGQGIRLKGAQNRFNYQLGAGATYNASEMTRFYGQLFIDDIKSPFNQGKFLGFSVGRHEFVLRKIAYLIGFHTQSTHGTGFTAEYDYADPFTYSYRNNLGVWQHGQFNWAGLPDGPDSKEVYLRADQKLGKKYTLAGEFRKRVRDDTSFIAPSSVDYAITGDYHLNNRDTFGLALHDYHQDPYTAADVKNIAIYAPSDQGYIGYKLRAQEADFSYGHVF